MPKKKKENTKVDIDKKSGSMAYNRFEFQLSETLHMAIELYDSLDYLLVLDYYDDITLFDNDVAPQFVSYYQVKSNEESISINTAIRENWLTKLYKQFQRKDWIVKELGLITNCPLKIVESVTEKPGKKDSQLITAERTPFEKFKPQTIARIKEDIAKSLNLQVQEIDLSKFVHMRTTLSITSHKEIVEQQMSDFLYKKYYKINVETVKTIYNSMLELLTRRQEYETLPDDADYNLVRQKKGVSKNDFTRVIEEAIVISIPPFAEIERMVDFKDDKYKATYEYTKIMVDSQTKTVSFMNMFRRVKEEVENFKKDDRISALENLEKICENVYKTDKT